MGGVEMTEAGYSGKGQTGLVLFLPAAFITPFYFTLKVLNGEGLSFIFFFVKKKCYKELK